MQTAQQIKPLPTRCSSVSHITLAKFDDFKHDPANIADGEKICLKFAKVLQLDSILASNRTDKSKKKRQPAPSQNVSNV
jgi:hypothetical protein